MNRIGLLLENLAFSWYYVGYRAGGFLYEKFCVPAHKRRCRMKISTKGRYALRMMIDLAEHQSEAFVSLKDIAARQGISKKYLEQIIPILNRSDFLQANRGAQGGYRLAKAPSAYTVKDILELTEGSLAPVACLDTTPVGCDRSEFCVTLPLWKGLRDAIENYLEGITLQDLLDRQTEMYSNNYMI